MGHTRCLHGQNYTAWCAQDQPPDYNPTRLLGQGSRSHALFQEPKIHAQKKPGRDDLPGRYSGKCLQNV